MKPSGSRGRIPRLWILSLGGAISGGVMAFALLTHAPHLALAAPLPHLDTTPTIDTQIVPTTAVGGSPITTGATVSTSSSGVALAVTLSCITTIAGLILFAATLVVLLRTGYGPFIRTLLRRRKGGKPNESSREQPVLRYQPDRNSSLRHGGPETNFDIYAEQSHAPRSSRRQQQDDWQDDNWDDWDNQPRRQSRPRASRRDW